MFLKLKQENPVVEIISDNILNNATWEAVLICLDPPTKTDNLFFT